MAKIPMRKIGIAGNIIKVLGLILFIVSLSTSHWHEPNSSSHSGLFESCFNIFGSYRCTEIGWAIDEAGTIVITTRAVLFIACIFLLIGIITGVLAFAGTGDVKVEAAMDIIESILIGIGCAAYAALLGALTYGETPSANVLGYSYYLGWVSAMMIFVGGLLEAFGTKNITRRPPQGAQVYPTATMQQQVIWTTQNQPGPVEYQIPRAAIPTQSHYGP
uniref:uncharacterized protein LOC120327045 n=1 Tax=Styela clava TaxID=7725 RepID=UPI001939EAFA|nr:uncharacterized protein LOC120327045 [Styela clava]